MARYGPIFTEDEEGKLATYWKKFEDSVVPKSNFRLSRFKLRSMKQGADELVNLFVKRLRVLVQECNFANPDEHLIDALIFGTNSDQVRSKLLKEPADMTFNKAIDIARTEEATKRQVQGMNLHASQQDNSQLHVLKQEQNNRPRRQQRPSNNDQRKCWNCGLNHDVSKRENCPAFNTRCNTCNILHHWSRQCRRNQAEKQQYPTLPKPNTQTQQAKPNSRQNLHALEQQADDTEQLYFSPLVIDNIGQGSTIKQAMVNININSKPVACKVDSGAEGNVIPIDKYKELFQDVDIKTSNTKIIAYGGHPIKNYGNCTLTVTHLNTTIESLFHVVESQGPVILGLQTSQDLKLITLHCSLNCTTESDTKSQPEQKKGKPKGNAQATEKLLTEYSDCFEGIGCFEGEYHIILDETVPPVVHPPRRIPEALRKPFKAELDSLCAQEILKKVDKPTDWVNSFVCVTKPNGSIRLCLDPKDLNKATKRPHHYTPTLEDILAKLNGAKYFSIVDARSGYWNIKLDEESSYYTTFNSPFGRYRFCRLPFGLICAQDVFQKKVDETFGDLTGVTGIADDIVVVGFKEDGSDHDTNLQAVMERARSTGLKFNPDKCVIKSTSIPFYGHILSANGLKVDPSKVEAINALDPSSSLPDLQSFLGATQYLSRFIPHMASVAAPLWDLVKKSSEFVWSPEHQAAVDKIKQAVAAPTSLKYFDSKKPVVVQVDASQRGLGAVLLQDNQPLAYSSKLLTDTERRYSNIEREMLGVVHGLEKFHYYCYGRPVVVQTDHKPLEAISKKHLASAPPRIARMLLRIQKYNAQVTYIPGKDIPLADALSRISPCPGDEIPGLDVSVHELHLHLNATPTRLDQIRDETAKDIDLALLRTVITNGWPKVRSECPSQLHAYWNYRDELTVADGIILKGLRIIIPKTLQVEVLNQLHYGHQGSEKCKLRAKGSVFWPNINQDIDIMVKQCAPCQRHQKENTKEPMIPHDVPQKSWHTLGADLFYWNNSHYLLVCDYYSKFPLVRKLANCESSTTIAHMKGMFEEHGIPDKLITGNDTQFTSEVFQKFSNTYGFDHVTTSPYYPQANGFIERNVQTVKNLLQKCKESGADPHLAMLCLRTTPLDHTLSSPAELLNSHVYKTNLPAISKSNIGLSADGDINSKLQERQDKQRFAYDKTAKSLSPLYPNEQVRVLNPQTHTWQQGIIKDATIHPRSYMVAMESGNVLRRNRRHLHRTGETFTNVGNVPRDTDNAATDVPCVPTTLNQDLNNDIVSTVEQSSERLDL